MKISRRDFLKASAAGVASVAAVGALAGCGGSSSGSGSSDDNSISDIVLYITTSAEIQTFNLFNTQAAQDSRILSNLVSGLCVSNAKGEILPGIAESWETNDDATEFTFHLRDDVVWVNRDGEEMAQLTADDFVAGLEFVLNFAKNSGKNSSMITDMVAGAEEYYNTVYEMDSDEATALTWDNDLFMSTVGVEAVDDYTVKYTMKSPKPYFYTLATYNALFPLSPAQLDAMTVDEFQGQTDETMWYCGPYILTTYINGNEKVFEPNPSWYGASEHKLFNSVTQKILDSADTAYTMYQSGDIDQVSLSESMMSTITEGTEYYDYRCPELRSKYSYQMHFAYNKNLSDGTTRDYNWNTAIANEAFRLSWYYGLDLTNYYKRDNPIEPLQDDNEYYTMVGVCVTTDGRDYTDLVEDYLGLPEANGETTRRYDPDKAAEYKAEAMEELSALGVTFPVGIDYYITGDSSTGLATANVLADIFKTCLGDDYVTLNICTYVSSNSTEVVTPHKASIYINGWGADYGDPKNFLGQEIYGDTDAYYATTYSCIYDYYDDTGDFPESDYPEMADLFDLFREFTDMVREADDIVNDMDERYDAFAQAEAYMIQHCLAGIPAEYNQGWQLTKVNDYTKANPPYGAISTYYYVDWETNADGYTTEEYEELKEAAGLS